MNIKLNNYLCGDEIYTVYLTYSQANILSCRNIADIQCKFVNLAFSEIYKSPDVRHCHYYLNNACPKQG